MTIVRRLPWLLIGFRLLAGPAMLALAASGVAWAATACVALLAAGVLSDIFDGVLARRLKVVTPALRTWDSRCDVLFWLSATGAAHWLHPTLWRSTLPLIAVLIVMEVATHLASWWRFQREASPHHLLSKIFGLSLWLLLTVLFLRGDGGLVLPLVFAIGVLSQIEAMAITLVLPAWRSDVRGIGEALRERRALHSAAA